MYNYTCLQCRKHFAAAAKNRLFCCRPCSSTYNNTHGGGFTGRTHSDTTKAVIGEKSKGNPYGQERQAEMCQNGYMYVDAPKGHPFANCRGRIKRARLVMEACLGRVLSRDEKVHHKDEDTLNDDIGNLEVLTASGHGSLHGKLQNRSRNPLGQFA